MATKDKSIYGSCPFKFIIEGIPFYVHADLISQLSKPLDRMINGEMAEAQQGFAVLKDVDRGTFIRFSEWAYKGYYNTAEFTIETEPSIAPDPVYLQDTPCIEEPAQNSPAVQSDGDLSELSDDVEDIQEFHESKRSKRPVRTSEYAMLPTYEPLECDRYSREELREAFIDRKYIVQQDSISIPPPRPNQDPDENYTEVFLSHARLYTFAEQYDIQALRVLALENLQNTLATFVLHDGRTGDVVELLRYVYANTGEAGPEVEDLRKLTAHYVGYEMETLIRDEGFGALMVEDGGELLGYFLMMVGKRMGD